ncbi:MAG: hypothetical protein JWO80_4648 [Bryobacterales bacterium]|nr:hypothetical protein [Bryobacterales bacterium]
MQVKLPDVDRRLVGYHLTHEATRNVIRGVNRGAESFYAAADGYCDGRPSRDREGVRFRVIEIRFNVLLNDLAIDDNTAL